MMRRIVLTDLRRALKKKSFIICTSLVIVLMIIITIVAVVKPASLVGSDETSGKALAFLNNISIAFSMIPFLVGIPVFQTVFSDDFKSRTMQMAIGRGMSRRRLILARFYEVIALLAEVCVILTVITVVTGLVLGATFGGLGVVIGKLWFDLILIISEISIAMLILYMSQNTTGGLVMYILLAADAFRLILVMADMIPFLKNNGIKLSNILPSGVHGIAKDYLFGHVPTLSDVTDIGEDLAEGSAEAMKRILDGTVDVNYLKAFLYTSILVGVFIILPLVLSQAVFRKKELEF